MTHTEKKIRLNHIYNKMPKGFKSGRERSLPADIKTAINLTRAEMEIIGEEAKVKSRRLTYAIADDEYDLEKNTLTSPDLASRESQIHLTITVDEHRLPALVFTASQRNEVTTVFGEVIQGYCTNKVLASKKETHFFFKENVVAENSPAPEPQGSFFALMATKPSDYSEIKNVVLTPHKIPDAVTALVKMLNECLYEEDNNRKDRLGVRIEQEIKRIDTLFIKNKKCHPSYLDQFVRIKDIYNHKFADYITNLTCIKTE